jgi:hypothetical protein
VGEVGQVGLWREVFQFEAVGWFPWAVGWFPWAAAGWFPGAEPVAEQPRLTFQSIL